MTRHKAVWVMLAVAVAASLPWIVYTSSVRSGEREREAKLIGCEKYLTSIKTLVELYRQDNGGKWPDSFAELERVYGASFVGVLRCPGVPEGRHGGDYQLVRWSGRALPADPALTPVAFDERAENHDGVRNVVMLDGSVVRDGSGVWCERIRGGKDVGE